MSTRRERAKAQNAQLNKQLEVAISKSDGMWKENLGKYLLDISKYVVTGVIIASLFRGVEESFLMYLLGAILAVSTLIVGLVLTNKKKEK